MARTTRWAGLALLASAAACADRPTSSPTDPTIPAISAAKGGGPEASLPEHERLARGLALALKSPKVRGELWSAMQASPDPERKIHFQWHLDRSSLNLKSAIAGAGGGSPQAIERDAALAGALEVYLPVRDHRDVWRGGPDVLVATAVGDRDPPIAFDLKGKRKVLDPERPPQTPVIALVPAEQAFVDGATQWTCIFCDDDDGGSPSPPPPVPGLYMTQASFTGTFEGWLKGAPEFETYVMGQDGSTANLKPYQCAGEHAGGPYSYDQNSKTWSGSVLLFSQAQLDQYKAEHPGQSVRIMVLEDDDTACVIKTKKDELTNLFQAADQAYQLFTGGRDSVVSLTKLFKRAQALQKIFSALASFVNTNDEIVGTAIEDAAAGITWPGTNWIVKGEDLVTNGAIRLEMR